MLDAVVWTLLIVLGLAIAFDFAIAACLIAGVASLLRGSKYVHELHGVPEVPPAGLNEAKRAEDVRRPQDAGRPEPARRRPADPAVPVTSGS